MKVKKLLLIPADAFVENEQDALRFIPFVLAKSIKRKFQPTSVYDAELQFYGDLPAVLGHQNVFSLGTYYPHFFSASVPEMCPYPSCHGTPTPTFVALPEAKALLREVDAILISTRAGQHRKDRAAARDLVTKEARKLAIPIAMVDFCDHPEIYGAADKKKELYNCSSQAADFDFYFKKDLPLGYKTKAVFPLAPTPVRPESYAFDQVFKKKSDIFYSGRLRCKAQADRNEVVALIRENFRKAVILEHESRKTFLTAHEYAENLLQSNMALSPSGISWDSFRHCEIGLSHGTALIAPKPYIETTGPPLQDGVNAILYDTEFRDGQYYLKNADELIEKIRYHLERPGEREKIAARWHGDIMSGHTIFARSKYIIDSIERAL